MTRDSIHISMSEPLRRAQVRPRLQSLAEATGLPAALVAARALVHCLAFIEGDLSRIFPAAAEPTVTSASATAPTAAPPSATASDTESPSTTATTHTPPHTPAQTKDTPHASAPSMGEPPAAAPPDVKAEPAPAAAVKTPTAPRTDKPDRVTAKVAAIALGYRDATAFHSFVFRHKDLKRYSRKVGKSALWDLVGLRSEYERRGWLTK